MPSARAVSLRLASLSALFWVSAAIIGIVAIRSAGRELLGGQGETALFGFVARSSPALDIAAARAGESIGTRSDAAIVLSRARAALRQNPLSSGAFVGAALALKRLGQDKRAQNAMETALRRDPRDLHARMWLITRSLEHSQFRLTLSHLDALMSLEPTIGYDVARLIIPLLRAPGMVDAFAVQFDKNPAWGPAFLDHARRAPEVAQPLYALMFELAKRRDVGLPKDSVVGVVDSAMARGDYAEARLIYGAFFPGTQSKNMLLNNSGLDEIDAPAPFNWTLIPNADVTAMLIVDGELHGLEIHALGGSGADVLSQTLTLPPGNYLIKSTIVTASLKAPASAIWSLDCDRSGLVLGTLVLPSQTRMARRVDGALTVPVGCPVQRLVLTVNQSRTSEGTMLIDDVSVVRTGA